jgi:penicillin-binding protein 2
MAKNNRFDLFSNNFISSKLAKKNLHLKSGHQHWTEEVFLQQAEANEMVGHNFNFNSSRIFSKICLVALLILLFRMAWLQIWRGDYYYSLAEGNRLRLERLEAKRGIIYDSQHKPLVQNVANFLVYVTPSHLPEQLVQRQTVLARLATVLGEETCAKLEAELAIIKPWSLEFYQPIFVSDNLTYEQAIQLTIQAHQLPGVSLTDRHKRYYTDLSDWLAINNNESTVNLNSLSLILGYIGKINNQELTKNKENGYLPIDYIGKTGLEAYYEKDLRGLNGSKQIEVDALGNEKKKISQQNPLDGHHLVLNIDGRIQAKLEEITRQHLSRVGSRRAAAIVINPNNGAVLAMVNQPSFDNNSFSSGISQIDYDRLINNQDKPMFNRSISGEYPSGSTVKIVMAVAALQEKIIDSSTGLMSSGGLRISRWFFPDWKSGGHGWTTISKAIAESVNTFFYYIGGGYENFVGLGLENIGRYLQYFGLGQTSGIDLFSEASGFIPTAAWKEKKIGEAWYIGDTYHLSIGQGYLLVTPLQVANYTSAFANGGKIYQPQLVKEILNSDESVYRIVEHKVIAKDLVNSENIEIVRQGMRQTILSGSAQSLKNLPVMVAGKTGTAQFDSRKATHSWFTGFAPFNDPEIVLTILVEEGGESTEAAVPIAKDFWQWYFTSLDTL